MHFSKLPILKIGLALWVLWHLAFGLLSTFSPEFGADLVGWTPAEGWDAELRAMGKQYGMVMLLLAGVYLIMLLDPIRYLNFLWIAVAEQVLGIAYGAYIFTVLGQLTQAQLLLQLAVNVALIVGMLLLWKGLRPAAPAQPA
ncbi:hypothetical protein [Algihabitans albus]|uniref:hypothetical protein n=1 Tax=Algihabitans albus TaxID=2164067 RepID=UPI000E5D9C2F|nr:hypothetical protein [Algihabitans albus]